MERRQRGKLSLIAAAAVLVGAAGLVPAEARAAYYWIHQAYNWSVCMDNWARSGVVWQYPCNPQENQQWAWDQSSPTWIILREKQNGNTLCLTAANPYAYAEVRAVNCNQGGYRAWKWIRQSGNMYLIQLDRGFVPDYDPVCLTGSTQSLYEMPLYIAPCSGSIAEKLWEPYASP